MGFHDADPSVAQHPGALTNHHRRLAGQSALGLSHDGGEGLFSDQVRVHAITHKMQRIEYLNRIPARYAVHGWIVHAGNHVRDCLRPRHGTASIDGGVLSGWRLGGMRCWHYRYLLLLQVIMNQSSGVLDSASLAHGVLFQRVVPPKRRHGEQHAHHGQHKSCAIVTRDIVQPS